MEVLDGIRQRRSIRSFKPDPVPRETLHQMIQICLRAPSWTNTQPWELSVVTGKVLIRLKRALREAAASDVPPRPDIPWPTFPDPYNRRRKAIGHQLYEVKGISLEDQERRRDWYLRGLQFFDAPVAIILHMERALNAWAMLDIGHFAMLLMLTAPEFGLGTCPQAGQSIYADVIRQVLGLPDSKLVLSSLAVGYPNWDDPINHLHSPRDPMDEFVRWYGGEDSP